MENHNHYQPHGVKITLWDVKEDQFIELKCCQCNSTNNLWFDKHAFTYANSHDCYCEKCMQKLDQEGELIGEL